jgi:HAD superfamily hydrolase (TIGR01450 family)
LVGLDRNFSYQKLHIGLKVVRKGAQLVATNLDPYCPTPNDVNPDTGAIVKAIEAASSTNTVAVTGKPSTYYAQKVLQKLRIQPEQCLMVGDRLETDILLGANSGMKTALVLTGVTSIHQIDHQSVTPNYVLSTLGDIILAI